MQCEDNSKLRTPLHEVCFSSDIGCVPIVDGKPDCEPMPDELPFAFDPRTTTLWLFNCRTRKWISFQKFRLCNDLVEVNLENLNNICDILRIPVFFNSGNECQEGWITLQDLVEQIKKCLQLKWQALCVDVDTLKISIKGLEGSLPPWYVRFENLWPVCGKGTEDDPVVIQTYDPLCKWPVKTVDDIHNATTKHLGACLDDKMVRVPFPPRPCEFPQLTEEEVAAVPTSEKKLIACVQGEEAKVPYPPMPCEFPQLSQSQVDAVSKTEKSLIACVEGNNVKVPFPPTPCEFPQYEQSQIEQASDVDMIFCVDGNNVKVPIPPNFFGPRPCEFPQYVRSQVEAGQDVDIIFCIDGKDVKVPIPPAFFTPEYLCVPEVVDKPTAPPAEGTGPLRVDCNGTIWIWVCETQIWIPFYTGPQGTPYNEVKDEITDPCVDIRFKGWRDTLSNPCVEPVIFNTVELAKLFNYCYETNKTEIDITNYLNKYGVEIYTASRAHSGYKYFHYTGLGNSAVIRSRDGSFARGQEGTNMMPTPPFGITKIRLTNNTDMIKVYLIFHGIRLQRGMWEASQADIGAYACLSYSPPFCELTTRAVDYFKEHGENFEEEAETCAEKRARIESDPAQYGIISGRPGIVGTEDFDISAHVFGWTANLSVATLAKDDIPAVRLEPRRGVQGQMAGGNSQMSNSMQVTSIYLSPGQTATVSQEVLFTLKNITGGEVKFGHGQYMMIAGFPANIKLNSEGEGDSDNDGNDGGDDD